MIATRAGRRSRSVRTTHTRRRVHARGGFRVLAPPQVGRTPGISCEAVAACDRGGAGMRRHLRPSAACGARVAEGPITERKAATSYAEDLLGRQAPEVVAPSVETTR